MFKVTKSGGRAASCTVAVSLSADWSVKREGGREFAEGGRISKHPTVQAVKVLGSSKQPRFASQGMTTIIAVTHVSHLVMLQRKQVAVLCLWQAAIKWKELIGLNAEHRKSWLPINKTVCWSKVRCIEKAFENVTFFWHPDSKDKWKTHLDALVCLKAFGFFAADSASWAVLGLDFILFKMQPFWKFTSSIN